MSNRAISHVLALADAAHAAVCSARPNLPPWVSFRGYYPRMGQRVYITREVGDLILDLRDALGRTPIDVAELDWCAQSLTLSLFWLVRLVQEPESAIINTCASLMRDYLFDISNELKEQQQ
jgi:hypothetical protein